MLEAATAAEQLGDPYRLTEAVLTLLPGGWASRCGRPDPVVAGLARRALSQLPTGATDRRARLNALLAAEASVSGEPAQARGLAGVALALARQSRDAATLEFVLPRYLWAAYDPEDIAGRRRVLDEAVVVAEQTGNGELGVYARACRVDLAVEAADLTAALADMELVEEQGPRLRQPFYAWLGLEKRSGLAQLWGDLDEAESLGAHALAVGEPAGSPAAASVRAGQLCLIRLDQGRAEEAIDIARPLSRELPAFPAWGALLGYLCCEAGQPERGRDELDRIAANGFADLPRNNTWRSALHCAAAIAVATADRHRARLIYRLLLPASGRLEWFGGGSFGPNDLPLGRLAQLLGDSAAADQHLRSAVTLNQRVGARGYRARSLLALAQLRPGDARSRAYAEDARRLTVAIGMPILERDAQRV